jgi:hypothetical protein
MRMNRTVIAWFATCFFCLAVGPTYAGDGGCTCVGDCDASCGISAEELGQAVGAIFDEGALLDCSAADADGDGRVSAADLVAIQSARISPPPGCVAEPTSTPTDPPPTSTPTRTMTSSPTNTRTPFPTSTPSVTPLSTPVSSWQPLAPLARGPRQEVGVTALGNTIYVIGGFAPAGTDRAEAYDVVADQWKPIAPLPIAVHHVGAASLNGFVYSIGGELGNSFAPTDRVFRYDPGRDEWEEVAPLPTRRGAMAVAVVDGRIHCAGGAGIGFGGAVGDHAAYDPASDTWTELAAMPVPREHLAGVEIGGAFYAVGGRSPLRANLHRYDAANDRWDELTPMPTARAGLAAAALAGRLVVLGGEGNAAARDGIFPQVEVYDPQTDTWTELDPMAIPRHGMGAAVIGDAIYVPGGATEQGFGASQANDALRIEF